VGDCRLTIKDLPAVDRPQERLLREGPTVLSSAELLAILLRTGTRDKTALEVAQMLLSQQKGVLQPSAASSKAHESQADQIEGVAANDNGSNQRQTNADYMGLHQLAKASVEELSRVKGIGRVKAAKMKAAFELGRRLAGSKVERPVIKCPKDVSGLLMEQMRYLDKEHFQVILLNTKNMVLGVELVSVGSLNTSIVHPREIFKRPIQTSAAAIILVHNHPSGDPTPSREDIQVTKRLQEAGQLLGINVLDHIVIGDNQFLSFREKGLI